MNVRLFTCLLFLPLLLFSCGEQATVIVAKKYSAKRIEIGSKLEQDEKLVSIIAPYKDQLDAEMNEVLAISKKEMFKGKPESEMGNLIADAVLKKCRDYHDAKIDFGFVNYGGIRVPFLSKGHISVRKIFELMPFDNMLVIMELDGETTEVLLDHIAINGGWPISGASFVIIDSSKATNIMIGNEPFDTSKNYTIALSDYLANGGDNLAMLSNLEHTNLNVLVRNALLEYFKEEGAKTDSITANLEGRITHAE